MKNTLSTGFIRSLYFEAFSWKCKSLKRAKCRHPLRHWFICRELIHLDDISIRLCQLHFPQYGCEMSTKPNRTRMMPIPVLDVMMNGLGGIWLIINPSIAPSLLCELLLVIAEATTSELPNKRPPHIRRRVISLLVFNLTMLFTRDSYFIHIHNPTLTYNNVHNSKKKSSKYRWVSKWKINYFFHR